MSESVLACRDDGAHVYEIDTDPNRLDLDVIHDFLANCSHWARGIPRATLLRAMAKSLCYGLYRDNAQIGFARVVTDEATFAYLADVFVIGKARNAGLGQWLVETLLADDRLQGLRRLLLVTTNAASLYRRCGFADLAPATYLEIWDPECYGQPFPLPVSGERPGPRCATVTGKVSA